MPILPDTFIVNIGDLMARWTNDEWVSTLHRVVNPALEATKTSRRQSLVFFHNPNYDAPVTSLVAGEARYPANYVRRASGPAVHGHPERGGARDGIARRVPGAAIPGVPGQVRRLRLEHDSR